MKDPRKPYEGCDAYEWPTNQLTGILYRCPGDCGEFSYDEFVNAQTREDPAPGLSYWQQKMNREHAACGKPKGSSYESLDEITAKSLIELADQILDSAVEHRKSDANVVIAWPHEHKRSAGVYQLTVDVTASHIGRIKESKPE